MAQPNSSALGYDNSVATDALAAGAVSAGFAEKVLQ